MTLVQTEPKSIKIGTTDIKRVMLGSTQIRPAGWTPGSNTLLYYDFEHTNGTTETDVAGNYNGTYVNTPTIGTLTSGKKYFNSGGNNFLHTNAEINNLNYNNATVCFWAKRKSTNAVAFLGQEWWGINGANGTIFWEHLSNGNENFNLGAPYTVQANVSAAWHNIVLTSNGSNQYLYVDGVYIAVGSNISSSGTRYFYVGAAANFNQAGQPNNINTRQRGNANFGSVIIENKIRTAQEISDYYNLTKGNYGL